MRTRRPAVAVMARVPGLGPVKSRLGPALTPAQATELYRCFLLDRLDALVALDGVDGLVAFTPPEGAAVMKTLAPAGLDLRPQRGGDLGDRLSNLLAELLEAGHPAALAIDSDSPTLPMAYVAEAARVLAEDRADVAVGPCDDGGYYLIGLRSPRPELFRDVPWSTGDVLPTTLRIAASIGLRVHRLGTWFDVDTERDLRRLHAEMLAHDCGPSRTFGFVADLYR